MQTYIVGGFVRDLLLSAEGSAARPNDRDWVVVGETPESMIRRGFKPVGEDFPVFLHPKTHEEYALARTERKTAPGYHGFVFHAAADVTLEEDLKRRDLTVNAIAMTESGDFIDPYGDVFPCNGLEERYWKQSMGNIRQASTFAEIWESQQAEEVRAKVRRCPKNCWMVGTASPVMHKYVRFPAAWALRNKLRSLRGKPACLDMKWYDVGQDPTQGDLREKF